MTKNPYIKTYKKALWTAFLLGTVFLFIAYRISSSELPDRRNTSKLTDILIQDIRIERGRRSKTLVFNLKRYPDINFQIGVVALDQTNVDDLITDNKTGDTVTMLLENSEYPK
ncbi:hypothetical protein [Chryseobacterium foetidum]|uniref:hypothetical protein n=1 Tax=Chryseobacterium foetidum TaxID=2951057 RepID=UPI0021C5E12F|nr:hypothetical protein [Chryseobacterium foetidum]